ncbi:MAG: endolytic transglycosylase MltG, partial [Actinomycetota bacterium]|nr:endolytic transglycosylase MltG [Actinomycetota bacterium]
AGTRRVSALQHKPGARRPVRRRSRAPRIPGRRHSRRGRIAGVLAIAVAVALIWFLVQLFQPFQGAGHGSVAVTIPARSSASQVGDLLERDGVVASSFFFGLRATLAGERSNLLPGRYHLKLGMPYGKVLSILTTPPPAAKVTALTLTEGRTRSQIDQLLRHQGVSGSYAAASRHSRLLDPRGYGAPRSTLSLEGFLFPSTYQLREPISVGALVTDQLKQFRKVFAGVNLGSARRRHLTPYDVLIIASMVEAESQTERDRRDVASVIYNRLAQKMPLQIDATTRYATGNYTSPLTVSQLHSNSPYNTRIRPGLPPTPIDNPGLESIEAAANPPRTNFLYFVVRPCGNGEMTFTGSYQQFLADAQRYQSARAQRGGRSPAHC